MAGATEPVLWSVPTGPPSPSNRWADPRARLLDGPRWEAMRADALAGLSLTEDAEEHLAQLTRGLDAAWRQMADRLEEAGADAKVKAVLALHHHASA